MDNLIESKDNVRVVFRSEVIREKSILVVCEEYDRQIMHVIVQKGPNGRVISSLVARGFCFDLSHLGTQPLGLTTSASCRVSR